MKSNRTSSFPAATKMTATGMVLSSIGMTLLTLALTIEAFARGSETGGWILAAITLVQAILLSINVTLRYHLNKKNSAAGP